MDMEHFIETVRKYPCLWNSTAIEYRDQELKDAAWAEVMKETDLSSVKEVKLKWKKLRDSYRDALKRQSDSLAKEPGGGAGGGSAAGGKNPWKYMAQMAFLQPHMGARKKPPPAAAGAANGEPNGEARSPSSDSSASEAGSPPPRRARRRLADIGRKLDYLCRAATATAHKRAADRSPSAVGAPDRKRECWPQVGQAAADPLDTFFSGMCQATKRLPFAAQIAIKKTVFGAVIAAEEALLAEQQSYAQLWAAHQSSSDSEADRAPDPPPQPPRRAS